MLFGFISGMVINRALGPEVRGDYAEVLSWAGIFASAYGLSVATTVIHFADAKYSYAKGELLGSMIILWLISCAIALAGTISILSIFPQHFSKLFSEEIIVIIFMIIGTIGIANLSSLLTITRAFKFLSITIVINAALLLSWLYLYHKYYTLSAVNIIYITCAIQYLTLFIFIIYILSSRRIWDPINFSLKIIKQITFAGLKVHIATFATLTYVLVDQLMVYHITSREQTGFYAVAATIGMSLMVFPSSIQKVLYSRLIESNSISAANISITVTKYGFYIFALCLFIFYFITDIVIILYAGSEFRESVSLLNIILIGILFFSIPNLLSPYWVKKGHFMLASLSAVTLLILNLVLNYMWIPQFGGTGAAWATNVTFFTGMIISLAMFKIISKQNPLKIFILNKSDLINIYSTVRSIIPRVS